MKDIRQTYRFIPFVGAVLFAAPAAAQVSSMEALQAFNAERAMYPGVGPLQWSPQLATFAQSWANHLAEIDRAEHRTDLLNNPMFGLWTGETIAGPADFPPFTVSNAIALWIAEKQWYHYELDDGQAAYKNTPPGCTAPALAVCGHFLQVIWKDTQMVGCGSGQAADGSVYIVCNYFPGGGWPGQKPY
jgi:pathogenesis-related protein 1